MLYWNIREFGAKGDGKTDDTAALVQGLEAAAKENGTLYFPMGNYAIHPVKVPSHVTLLGNSAWGEGESSKPDSLGHTRLTALSGEARALLDLDACMGTRLIGLTLDGKNLGTKMHGIYSCHGGVEQNNCYEDCLICNFSGSGLKMDWVWVFAVRRCRITNNRLYGIDVDRGYDGWVIDNNIVKNGLWGINAGPGMVCYTANTVAQNLEGGLLADDTQNINVTGNSFRNNGGPGILIRNSRACAVSGNTVLGNGAAKGERGSCGLSVQDSVGITIVGNTISEGGPLKGGPQVPEIGLEARGLEDCTITGNTLYRSARREWLKTSEHQRSVIANNTGSLAV